MRDGGVREDRSQEVVFVGTAEWRERPSMTEGMEGLMHRFPAVCWLWPHALIEARFIGRKLRHREARQLAQSPRAKKQHRQASKPSPRPPGSNT